MKSIALQHASKVTYPLIVVSNISPDWVIRLSWNFGFLPKYVSPTYCENISQIGDIDCATLVVAYVQCLLENEIRFRDFLQLQMILLINGPTLAIRIKWIPFYFQQTHAGKTHSRHFYALNVRFLTLKAVFIFEKSNCWLHYLATRFFS